MAALIHIALAFATVGVAVAMHLVGLTGIGRLLDALKFRVRQRSRAMQMVLMGTVVCCIFALHLTEIALYALFFWWGGALTPFDTAFYFSATTFTTIGYGDVTVDGLWRLNAALEGLTGITLAGWSVAFLVTVVRRLDQWQRRSQTARNGD